MENMAPQMKDQFHNNQIYELEKKVVEIKEAAEAKDYEKIIALCEQAEQI